MNGRWTSALVAALVAGALAGTAPAQTYTLEISRDPVDGGAFQVEPDQEAYDFGTDVTVYAVPFEGFRFVGWSGDISAPDGMVSFTITGDTNLTALFEAAEEVATEFQVVTLADPQLAGYITLEPAAVSYEAGTEVMLTAAPEDGFVFAGWTGDVPAEADATQPTLTVTVDGDLNLTANFEALATAVGETPATPVTPGSNAEGVAFPCGVLGMTFWPLTLLGLMAFRRR